MNHRPHIDFQVGQNVIVTNKIVNGLIEVEPLTTGFIAYHPNQVVATVWFRSISPKTDRILKDALQTDKFLRSNGNLDGITLEVKREYLAHRYYYASDFGCVLLDKCVSNELPLFCGKSLEEFGTRRYIGNEKAKAYKLDDILSNIEDNFADWIEKELTLRPVTEFEKENEEFPYDWDYVYTSDSMDKYWTKKEEIELAVARVTGVYKEFTGGMSFE